MKTARIVPGYTRRAPVAVASILDEVHVAGTTHRFRPAASLALALYSQDDGASLHVGTSSPRPARTTHAQPGHS